MRVLIGGGSRTMMNYDNGASFWAGAEEKGKEDGSAHPKFHNPGGGRRRKKIGRCVVALGKKKKWGGEGAPEIFPVSRARIYNAALGREQEGESPPPPNSIPFPHAISTPENRPSKLIGGWHCFTIASEEELNGQLELGKHFWDVYKDLGDPSARKGRQRTKLGEEYGERKGDFDRSEYTSWEMGQTSAKKHSQATLLGRPIEIGPSS